MNTKKNSKLSIEKIKDIDIIKHRRKYMHIIFLDKR